MNYINYNAKCYVILLKHGYSLALGCGPQGAAPGAHRGEHHVLVVLEMFQELQGVAVGRGQGPRGLQTQKLNFGGLRKLRERLAVQEIALLPLLVGSK